MHIVFPVLPEDLSQVESLLNRIANIGGASQFPCLLVAPETVDLAKCQQLASSAFQSCSVFYVDIPVEHPKPRNILFARTAYHVNFIIGDGFLYLERDAWPLHPMWLKDLTTVYREHGYRFMGKLALVPDGTGDRYLMPTAIYPKDFYLKSNLVRQLRPQEDFALFLKDEIVHLGKAHDSGLFTLDESSRTAALMLGKTRIGDALHEIERQLAGTHATNESLPQMLIDMRVAGFSESPIDVESMIMERQSHQMGREIEQQLEGNYTGAINPNGLHKMVGESGQSIFLDERRLPHSTPAAEWTKSPEVFTGEPIPEPMKEVGTLDPFPQPAVEIIPGAPFATTADRNAAIKTAKAAGMSWKALLGTFKVGAVELKRVLNEV